MRKSSHLDPLWVSAHNCGSLRTRGPSGCLVEPPNEVITCDGWKRYVGSETSGGSRLLAQSSWRSFLPWLCPLALRRPETIGHCTSSRVAQTETNPFLPSSLTLPEIFMARQREAAPAPAAATTAAARYLS